MSLFDQIKTDTIAAMKAKEPDKVVTLRFLQAAIKNKEIELRPNPLNDKETLLVIKKLIKQRQDSIEQFSNAGRQELADKETLEMKILQTYLPKQMSREQVEALVEKTVTSLNANSIKQMGAVMKAVIDATGGAADNKMISELVKLKLT